MHTIAIFGGTFDPIHNGHLQVSLNLQNTFHFHDYFFLPCKIPVLKSNAIATNQERIDMIKLAIKDHSKFHLDLREINRKTASYMFDTLNDFRIEYPQASISLIIGYDAFLLLPQWFKWQKILDLAHLLVINRKTFSHQSIPKILQSLLQEHQTKNKSKILNTAAGSIILFNAGDYNLSSTAIREAIKHKLDFSKQVPLEVEQYIKQLRLYQ